MGSGNVMESGEVHGNVESRWNHERWNPMEAGIEWNDNGKTDGRIVPLL